jgi:hypothetical protein
MDVSLISYHATQNGHQRPSFLKISITSKIGQSITNQCQSTKQQVISIIQFLEMP